MRKAILFFVSAIFALFAGVSHALAQHAQSRAPAENLQLKESPQKRVAEFRGQSNVVIHQVELPEMDVQTAQKLLEIADEANCFFLAMETNVIDAPYEVALSEPDAPKEKLDTFTDALIAAKAREGN